MGFWQDPLMIPSTVIPARLSSTLHYGLRLTVWNNTKWFQLRSITNNRQQIRLLCRNSWHDIPSIDIKMPWQNTPLHCVKPRFSNISARKIPWYRSVLSFADSKGSFPDILAVPRRQATTSLFPTMRSSIEMAPFNTTLTKHVHLDRPAKPRPFAYTSPNRIPHTSRYHIVRSKVYKLYKGLVLYNKIKGCISGALTNSSQSR